MAAGHVSEKHPGDENGRAKSGHKKRRSIMCGLCGLSLLALYTTSEMTIIDNS